MARGTQLLKLVEMLKAEIGSATSVAVGVDFRENLKQTLRRTQNFLFNDYGWPHLRMIVDKNLAAGQRYYDLPTEFDYARVERIVVWWGGSPLPLDRGINIEDYGSYDSAGDERADPPMKWDVRWTGTTEQLEVWPIPASTYSTTNKFRLQIQGLRKLRSLVNESDVADLDDDLIVMFAAAEYLARQKSADASAKLQIAQQFYRTLKGRATTGTETFVFGRNAGPQPAKRETVIRVGRS